jgi:hypothetical protein
MTVQVLVSAGCGHGQQTADLVRDVLRALAPEARLELIDVATDADAQRLAFPGSPTVLVDGADIDPGPPGGVGLG